MKFAQFNVIYGMWAIAALIFFLVLSNGKRQRALERFADKGLIEKLSFSFNPGKRKIKMVIIFLAMTLMLAAAMRPQYGFHWEEVKRKGLDILIAIDTSKSMLAEDVKPNRLERSKLAVKDLIGNLKGDRIGLIAFSGSAFLQCPLTVDYGGFMLSLDNLDIDAIPKGGTSISSAINEALESYEGGLKKYKILVLITDGEDHTGDPVSVAKKAAKEGVKIFCIGIGTKEGELIPVAGRRSEGSYLKDNDGNVVKSRLNEEVLQRIALSTGGSYVRATGAEFGLDLIYDEKLSRMEKRELESKMHKRYEERFQIPLFLGFLLLLLEPFISEKRRA
ncbi:MAG: VWA domain-containing protein [Candidatus Omnitrophica bacterium]|nr:VWA domain-containing protein [Candidatus Omnitrophota bacterium]